ncbi:DEAD/DEAH box helicase [Actinomadura sp. 7K507]|uniref:DEAD/DEAH box helicase n=1 Tax=Actinomadura sp. 7K507 TaxID=2530365 RepID=UPI00104970A2|nr:DEAD/DEAH box helicase [Actinomadura sp. 7K507]TDC75640.1 DEAD/DEAH box helicase [Actinomadura sp. 7K507]
MSKALGGSGRPGADRWAHQPVAVAAIEAALGAGGRATGESACGSGKSRIAAQAAARLAPEGRVLVTVPTLELVAQMLATFAEHGRPLGRVVAVCSDAEVLSAGEVELGGAKVTTDAARLAELTRVRGRVTVLCTYQSLGVLAGAHAEHRMPSWDLVVVDEAHRTAGRAGRSWSLIHDDVVIPAARRLYLTATPKILGAGGDDTVVSMDDEKVYGPVVFRFTTAQGIDRGLLADYELVVVVVTDEQVRALATDDDRLLRAGTTTISPRALATQIAVLRAAREYRIRAAITFHNRIADARAWADALPHAWKLMPAGQRPAAVSALHVHGGQAIGERRRALGSLRGAHHNDDAGDLVRVVCNARVLTEGVDAPAVDAVAFIDPRDSMIDIVQGIGRALRTGGRTDKTARVIVPVLLGPEEDPQSALDGSAYAQVWRVIRALRAVDDRLAIQLDTARQKLGQNRSTSADDQTDNDQAYEHAGEHADDGDQEDPLELWDWLKVSGVPAPEAFARAIQVRAVRGASPSWLEFYGLAKAYHQAHGNLDLTVEYRAPDGTQLGQWVRNQRRHRAKLDPRQVELLEEIGLQWDSPLDRAWQDAIAAARAWAHDHDGQLHGIPNTWTFNGVQLSRWLVARRRDHRDGKLPAERKAALDAIDPTWLHTSDDIWDVHYQAARAFYHAHEHLHPDPDYRGPDGLDLPDWLDKQRRRARTRPQHRGHLTPDQKRLLDEIGMPWTVIEAEWQKGLAAARAYTQTHGDLHARTTFVTDDGFPLGRWLYGRRKQAINNTLDPQRLKALEALDPTWQTALSLQSRWDINYQAARRYAEKHGHLPRSRGAARDPAPQGHDFRRWLTQQRQNARRGHLTPERHAALDALDPNWRGTTKTTNTSTESRHNRKGENDHLR